MESSMVSRLRLMTLFLFLFIGIANAQVSRVSGVVLSADDMEPIVGATVLVNGTSIGTITDVDGFYTITDIPASAKTLTISYVGMKPEQLPIKAGEQRTLLQTDSNMVDEIVVPG